ncbi:MAG: glycosyl transferase group 1 [Verrucomicrobiaceae bacterium]|nr:glycosyl transferase group 1 [Verrucomicrobiaceae bacterium]
MKLALLIRDLGYAGAQRQLVAIAKGVDPRQIQATVFCFYGGPLKEELEASGIRVVCLEKRHRWDMLGFLWRVIAALRQARPDVLYSFLAESNLLAALIVRFFLPNTRLVWGLRDSETDAALYGWLGRLVFALGRFLSRWPHLIIANSHSGARYYATQGYPSEKITVVPNGIDIARFKPNSEARATIRAELGIRDDEVLFGIVGRLSPMKDYATFLRAAATLDKRCRFLCIGAGSSEYAQEMQALANELGLAGGRLIWSAPRSDMPQVFNALDALVSSSAFGEGFSNVAGEAMACGTPCIVTDVGDSAWLVGDAGFSVPPRQPEALAAAMRQFLTLDPAALKSKARQRIEENFTVPTMVQRTTELLGSKAAQDKAPIKLLFVITALGTGGAEMMLTQLITHLDPQRFSPHVISLTEGGKYAAILNTAGIPVHHLSMAAGKPSLRSLMRLRLLTRDISPALIIGWMYHGNLAATLASWIGSHVPVLWNVRQSLYSLALEKRSSAMVIKLLARLRFNPAQILYNSQISARQHEGIGYDSRKTMIVPNGFNTDAFKPDPAARQSVREELNLPADSLLIGRFGRYSAMKDYPTFIAAMQKLQQTHPQARAIIAGTGTEGLKADASFPSNIIVLGERNDLPRLTSAIDIACSSSAFGEGFPNVVAEAMSSSIPCVATDVGDSAWLLGNAGRVVAPNDAEALAQALSELLTGSPQARQSLGQQGRQRILTDFSLPAVVSQFESLFAASSIRHSSF